MRQAGMNPTVMRVFLWSGVVVIAALIIAQGLISGFIPGISPNLSAEETARIFIERKDRILLGSLIQCICWCLYGTWAIPIILFIRKMEDGWPALTYASLVNIGGGWVFFILIPVTWTAIAFRAETLDPQIIQIMNDWVWFDWLFTWPSFSVWMFIIAAAIFLDHNSPTIFPRWVAFFNLWAGILICPAGFIGFFKEGPFAYDGLISFWFAVVVFFGWMVVMTLVAFRAVAVEQNRHALAGSEASKVHRPAMA
jgi:hypothetical protein